MKNELSISDLAAAQNYLDDSIALYVRKTTRRKSYEDLAKELGISRQAVQQRIMQLIGLAVRARKTAS